MGLVFLLLLAFSVGCVDVTIRNDVPQRDQNGVILDAHDGSVLYHGGAYLRFAASYGLCKEPRGGSGCSPAQEGECGFQTDHNVSLFRSTDLVHWESLGVVFSASQVFPASILYCPKVLYNAAKSEFVMWVDLVRDSFRTSYYAVAVSDAATGPFRIVNPNVTTLRWPNTGDYDLFQDEGGGAFIIYTSFITGGPMGDHVMSVEPLMANYRSSDASRNSGVFGAAGCEAPALFRRNKTYVALFGRTCCFCRAGAPVVQYDAPSPLGPYTQRGAIDSVSAQQTAVFAYASADGTTGHMWMGDRWQQAPDGIKAHDPTYFQPLRFASDGSIVPFGFQAAVNATVCA